MLGKLFAFVLMPFDEEFDDVYRLGIKPAAELCGFVAERVDEQKFSDRILDRIYRQIESADLVIADMTGRNPNVFYEVGYAHAKEKRCILITNNAEDIPFDLSYHRHLIYGKSINKLKEMLRGELDWIIGEIESEENKPFEARVVSASANLDVNDWRHIAEVDIVFEIRNKSNKKSPEIHNLFFVTKKYWEYKQDDVVCPSSLVEGDSDKKAHFVKTPLNRLTPGNWMQVKLVGERIIWSKYTGDEAQESYQISGRAIIEIVTDAKKYEEEVHIKVTAEEFPF